MKKIFFKNLIIKNFLSFGNQPFTISFTKGINIITGIDSEWEILRLTMKDFKIKTIYYGKEYVIELVD